MSEQENNGIYKEFRKSPVLIAGPCAVESEEQIKRMARIVSGMGIKFLRAGAFKPRTSPRSFQGLGLPGLKFLRNAADEYGLKVVSEIMNSSLLPECYDLIDIIQVGSRNMDSYGLLKAIGKATARDKKPVLIKRGFNATLKEFLMASEYITAEGNPNVILCLRGIRTFEQIDSAMRFTPDLGAIPELKDMTSLPVIFDPSHSTGNAAYVESISAAALLLGADGLLIEVHDDPLNALSDGTQSILPQQLENIIRLPDKKRS